MFTEKNVSTSSRVIIVMSVVLGAFILAGSRPACAEDYTGLESVALLDALGKSNSTPVIPQPRGSYGGMESTALLDVSTGTIASAMDTRPAQETMAEWKAQLCWTR